MKFEINSSKASHVPCSRTEATEECHYFKDSFLAHYYAVKEAPENTTIVNFTINLGAEEITEKDQICMEILLRGSIFFSKSGDTLKQCTFAFEGDFEWLGKDLVSRLESDGAVQRLKNCDYWSKKIVTQDFLTEKELESFFNGLNEFIGFKPGFLSELSRHGFDFPFVDAEEIKRRNELVESVEKKYGVTLTPGQMQTGSKEELLTVFAERIKKLEHLLESKESETKTLHCSFFNN